MITLEFVHKPAVGALVNSGTVVATEFFHEQATTAWWAVAR